MGPYWGVGSSEPGLLRGLHAAFSGGDVLLADALFCNYFLIATFAAAGVDVLFEQHGARITDFRRGRTLGARDHVVCWPKPATRPQWMTQEQYQAFPDQLTVREVKVEGRVLVTTMLDQRKVSKGELDKLYARRWNVELDLRNIKITLGMQSLSCQTPQMNEKEMWVHLLAYNLIRLLMAQAACRAGVHPRQLSFKHTAQIWTHWTSLRLTRSAARHDAVLFTLIAQLRVGDRPGRVEPRAIKRRPKSYPLLTVPRAKARWNIAIHGHA
jgi:Transposase DDE domain